MTQTQCTAGPARPRPSRRRRSRVARALAVARQRLQAVPAALPLPRDRPAARGAQPGAGPGHAGARGAGAAVPAAGRAAHAAGRSRAVSPAWAQLCADDPGSPPRCSAARPGPPTRPDPRPHPVAPDDLSRTAPAESRVRRSRAGWRAPSRSSTPTSRSRTRGCSNPRPGSCWSRSSWSRGCCCAATSTGSTGAAGRRHDPRGRLQDRQRAPPGRRGTRAVPDEVLRAGAAVPARGDAHRAAAAVPDRPRGTALRPG